MKTNSILLISHSAPSRAHAGGLRLLDLYSELRRLRPNLYLVLVTFNNRSDVDWGGEALDLIFDEVYKFPLSDLKKDLLNQITFKQTHFDLVDLQYHHCASLINACRKKWPTATIAYSPMVSYLRACMVLMSSKPGDVLRMMRMTLASVWHGLREVVYVKGADRVITVSDADRSAICHFKSAEHVYCIPTGLSTIEFPADAHQQELAQQPIIVFFAYFGAQPNQDALIWYCKKVHPRIQKAVKGYRLHVIGQRLTQELISMCNVGDINFVGPVETVAIGLQGAMVGIAPALSGGGVRGKIHQYAALGIPCVAAPMACESLKYQHGESILVAEEADDFADACIALLRDIHLRNKIGAKAREICLKNYSWHALDKEIVAAYSL